MLKHFAAFKARLAAALPAAVSVEDTAKVDGAGGLVRAQYVILFGGGPDELDDGRLAAPQSPDSDAEYLYTVRCVGVTADGARMVAQKVIAIVGQVITVEGRACSPLELDDSSNVEPDNAVKPPLWYLDLDFLLKSSRAVV